MTVDLKKVLILNLPYLLFVYLFDTLATLSTRTSYDAQGVYRTQVDEDLRHRLETKLIVAILKFELN